jgi:hypothetical protein
MLTNRNLVAYFGHHKCATTWIKHIIVQVCTRVDLKWAHVFNQEKFGNDLKGFVKTNNVQFLIYTGGDFKYVNELDNFIGFHVIRDPRDIVVSAYFSHLYSHPTENWPELLDHREKLSKVSKDEGLFLEMEFRKREFENLYNWNYSQPNTLEMKMEELIHKPYEKMVKAFEFLELTHQNNSNYSLKSQTKFLCYHMLNKVNRMIGGLLSVDDNLKRIPVEELLGMIYHNRFSVMSNGRKAGEEDNKHHYRKGVGRDWVNHFSMEHREHFKRNYNDLLLKLGYEEKPDW